MKQFPSISVILCTRNNALLLEPTLVALAKQKLPGGVSYEVIIVNNNSTDHTEMVARKFASLPDSVFRYHFEPIQGLSLARNNATAIAQGEIIAFIDDDAIADEDWLRQIWTVYEREPEAVGVGGKVVLRLPPGPLPSWYSAKLDGFLSARDLPYGAARGPKDFPIGANMSFRKWALQKVGGFHPLLGARKLGKVKLRGEEPQLCLRVMKVGTIYFQPTARVEHVIPENRLQKEYLLSLAMGSGYEQVIIENDGQVGVSTLVQLKKYCRKMRRLWWESVRRRSTMSEADRFFSQMMLQMFWFSIRYCLFAKRQLQRIAKDLPDSRPP